MTNKIDFKKEYKDLYLPKAVPMIIDVPKIKFIMIDGKGDPNEREGEYNKAVETLYALSYTIKMSHRGNNIPFGYFEYVVPPLEGLWWMQNDELFDIKKKDRLLWTSMIRQPDFVTDEVFLWSVKEVKKKKKSVNTNNARLVDYTEGLCVQMMHLGPFDNEDITVKAIDDYAKEKDYVSSISKTSQDGIIKRHHEIYLSDPRKVSPEKLKTVVRHPIETLIK